MKYGEVTLTEGNLRNSHLYLVEVMDLFPESAVGGSSERERAQTLLEIHWGAEAPVVTDIAGDKHIFRKRSWVRKFLEIHDLHPHDVVVIERTGPCSYHIYPRRG